MAAAWAALACAARSGALRSRWCGGPGLVAPSLHWRAFGSKSDAKEDKEEESKVQGPVPPGQGRGFAAGGLVPGVAASAAVAAAGFGLADVLGKGLLHLQGVGDIAGASSPISGIPCAIMLGMALRNQPAGLPSAWLAPGVKFSTKKLLQYGIVSVGVKLSAVDLLTTGAVGLPAVLASIGAGLTFVPWFGRRMGLPRKMSSLIAAGTSICGVTAITAVSPAISARQEDTAVAVANVVMFGTLAMLAYPYLAHHILAADSHRIGMFLGLAVHDTSQAIGSALTYSNVYSDEVVLKVAAITKLSRNLCLAAVVPWLTYLNVRAETKDDEGKEEELEGKKSAGGKSVLAYVPPFVAGFCAMTVLRSVGDVSLESQGLALGLLEAHQWRQVVSFVGNDLGSTWLLGTAMAAVGLNTDAAALKGVGYRPFVVGFAGSAVVAGTGCAATLALTSLFL